MAALPKLLDRLDGERRAILEALEALPPDLRARKPSPDAWSPLEIAEHVFKSEAGVLRGVARQLDPNGQRKELAAPSSLRFGALMLAMRSSRKFLVPEAAASVSPSGMTFEEIRSNWAEFSHDWRRIAESIPGNLARVGLIRHPVSGPMTLSESIRFLAAHSARHFRQLERTIARLAESPTSYDSSSS